MISWRIQKQRATKSATKRVQAVEVCSEDCHEQAAGTSRSSNTYDYFREIVLQKPGFLYLKQETVVVRL